jgi:hypothetical protein
MGCTQSRKKFKQYDVEAKPTAMRKFMPGSNPLVAANTYTLKNRIFRMHEDYDIEDKNGLVAFKVAAHMLSLHAPQFLLDKKGKKVCMLRKEFSGTTNFYLYSYSPAFEGQESTEKDDEEFGDKPVYRFGKIKTVFPAFPSRWEYHLYRPSNEFEKVGEISSVCSLSSQLIMQDVYGIDMFKLDDCGRVKKDRGGTAEIYKLDVANGVDPLQAIAIALTCQQLSQDEGLGED